MAEQKTQIINSAANNMMTLLKRYQKQIEASIPEHFDPDKMLRLVVGSFNRTPKLLECTPSSVLNSVLHLGQLGLQPRVNEAYLLPFNSKKGNSVICTPVIDYRGKIKLARQSGLVRDIEPHLVYANDTFELTWSTDPTKRGLTHKPLLFKKDAKGAMKPVSDADRGEPVLGYAIGWLVDADPHVEVMTYADIEHVRSKSPAATSGPWVTDWGQMGLKTLVHRICKMLPWSGEKGERVQRAQELEDKVDMEMEIDPILELAPQDDHPLAEPGSMDEAQRIADEKIAAEKAAERGERGQQQSESSDEERNGNLFAQGQKRENNQPTEMPKRNGGGFGKER